MLVVVCCSVVSIHFNKNVTGAETRCLSIALVHPAPGSRGMRSDEDTGRILSGWQEIKQIELIYMYCNSFEEFWAYDLQVIVEKNKRLQLQAPVVALRIFGPCLTKFWASNIQPQISFRNEHHWYIHTTYEIQDNPSMFVECSGPPAVLETKHLANRMN